MSMFEDNHYRWRETYFVLFDSRKQPPLKTVEKTLAALSEAYELRNPSKGQNGRFESLTVISPDDFAALDICYTAGDEVREQGIALAKELRAMAVTPEELARLKQIAQFDARFDVLHFEQVVDLDADDEVDEVLDPSALLLVLNALAKLTDGIAVDPQSGTILDEEQ